MNIPNMLLNLIVYIVPIIAAIYIIVGILLYKYKGEDQINYFSFLMFATAIYSFGYFLELNCVQEDMVRIIRDFEFFGSVFIPTFGILFIAQLIGTKVAKKTEMVLFAVSLILWSLLITNPLHHLIYQSMDLNSIQGFTLVTTVKGPAYYSMMAYYAVFLMYSSIVLIKAYKQSTRKNRKNSYLFLFTAFQFAWPVMVLILLGYADYIDFTPGTIIFISILIGINEIKNDMFELEISRWKNTFCKIGEPVFLVNKSGEIICSNGNAKDFLSASKTRIENIIKNLDDAQIDRNPAAFIINDQNRWFEVEKSFFNPEKRLVNYLLIDRTADKQAQQDLMESEEKYRFLVTQMKQGLAVHEIILDQEENPVDYRFLDVNESFEKMTGQKRENILGKTVLETLPGTESYWIKKYGHVALTGEAIHYEDYSKELNKYFEVVAYAPRYKEFAVIISDISNRKKLEIALSNEKNILETTLKSVGDGVISTDTMGKIVFLNKVGEDLTGWTQEDAKGKGIEEVFNIINEFTGEKSDNIVKNVLETGNILELDKNTILVSKDDIQRPIEDSAAPILNENGEIAGVVLVFRDFSEKKKKQEEILYLNYHDYLTGLYNRRYYEEALERLDTKENLPITLIMGDVNGLKLINDSFGHTMGDELLQKAAKTITEGSREDDIVARLGGDEFIVVLPRTDIFEAEEIVKRIRTLTAKEKIGDFDVSISFGYETKEFEEEDLQDIFKKAEDDMYRHKLYESTTTRSTSIEVIMKNLYEKSHREMRHSKSVGKICEAMGIQMNFNEAAVNEIKMAGIMHDIGKMGIDEKSLNNPTRSAEDEIKEIHRHPEIGYRILSASNEFSAMAKYVLEHHERWDGKGYPKGLKDQEISLQARMIAVADAFDSMTNKKCAQKSLNREEAINEIKRNMGTQFDPAIATLFLEKCLPFMDTSLESNLQ